MEQELIPAYIYRIPTSFSGGNHCSWSYNTGLASLVLGELADAKEVHFPKLKNVHMSHIENPSGTKVSGENAGIVLELDDEGDDYDEDGHEEDGDAEGNDEIAPMEESE